MSWTVNYQPLRNHRGDDVLLALGRATYAASQFEGKSAYVLRMINLIDSMHPSHAEDPVMGLKEAISRLPKDGTLYGTLQRLALKLPAKQSEDMLLHRARDARNFIVHEGAQFGIHYPGGVRLTAHLDEMYGKVRDLAAGDNLISSWAFGINNSRESVPVVLMAGYEDALVRWILGPVWDLLTDPTIDVAVPNDGQFHERIEHYRIAYPNQDWPG